MDIDGSPQRDPEVIALSQQVLVEMQKLSSALLFATVVTEDGFEVASISSSIALTKDDRVASMVSSISALSDAISATLELNTNEYVVLNSVNGIFVVRAVNNTPLVIAGVFSKTESLGKALVAIDLTRAELLKLLGR
jgi:predicted regulator of Ras-like GTPase activity (Roadblock/LC7/MglB family)